MSFSHRLRWYGPVSLLPGRFLFERILILYF